MEVHIRRLDTHKPFNGRGIKDAAVIQCLFQLAPGNRQILKRTVHIGKLQTDKLDILLFHHADNVLFRVFTHVQSSPFAPVVPVAPAVPFAFAGIPALLSASLPLPLPAVSSQFLLSAQ